jgi:hypothetical protein
MPATDLQVFKRDAELLYLRGLQCAREGNRAGAALALRQAISLNPLHEQAWLRLSDTLDDPHEIAVCLQIALQINPNNAQARRSLTCLRHQMRGDGNVFASPLLAAPRKGAPDAWWRAWHKAQRAWIWSLRTLLVLPILLLGSTLGLRAVIANQHTALPFAVSALAAAPQAPMVNTTDPATTLSYFSTLNVERQSLQAAAATYEASTAISQTTQERIDATLHLLDQIRQSHTTLAALPVPSVLADAHQQYLEGLALEHDALKQILELHQEYRPQQARAAVEQMQAARARIDLARSTWAAYGQGDAESSTTTNGQ